MRVRYDNWVGGLTGDWLISRQRFFGVPIPVWYELDADGEKGAVIVPDESALPIDPSSDVPPGYTEADRGIRFAGELDIMDTWATSSLTPQIAGGWETDPELFSLVFPYSLRSQGQDIIRTWLFSTVLRAELEHGQVPWENAGISGFIVDPDRKKMSKSKGNVVTPKGMLDEHGSDAVRYWAASSRLGTDAAFDPQNPKQIKIGRRLAIKVLNASKFVYSFPAPASNRGSITAAVTEPLDLDMLATLAEVVATATEALDNFDHARALETTEKFFWVFTDDYLELVKERAYGASTPEAQASASAALRVAIDVFLRLFAPYIPFATEEVWSWTHDDSVHTAAWPTVADLGSATAPSGLLDRRECGPDRHPPGQDRREGVAEDRGHQRDYRGPRDSGGRARRPEGGWTHRYSELRRRIRNRSARHCSRGGNRVIRPIAPSDRGAWDELFLAYGVFYETSFTSEVLDRVWALMLEPTSGVDALVAEKDGQVVAFAHYRSHPDTFTGGRDWYLDDLYVSLDARGAGLATELVEHIAELARAGESGGTLRWITAADNARAQRVYDRIALKTDWVMYEKRF